MIQSILTSLRHFFTNKNVDAWVELFHMLSCVLQTGRPLSYLEPVVLREQIDLHG